MNLSRVTEIFGLLSQLPQEENSSWEGLCFGAIERLKEKLKEDVDMKKHEERLATAAAAFAYADYLMISGTAATGEQVRVGDISFGGGRENRWDSQSIRDYFTVQISDLLKVSGFKFSAIPEKGEVFDET